MRTITTRFLALSLWFSIAPSPSHGTEPFEVFEYSGSVLEMERFLYEIDWPAGFEVCGYPEGMSFTGFFFVADKKAECEPDYRLRHGSVSIHGNHNVIERYLDLDSQVREACLPSRDRKGGTVIGNFGKWAGERAIACQFVDEDGTIVLLVQTQSPVPPPGTYVFDGVGAYAMRARILTDPERFNRDRATLRRVLRGFRWTVPAHAAR